MVLIHPHPRQDVMGNTGTQVTLSPPRAIPASVPHVSLARDGGYWHAGGVSVMMQRNASSHTVQAHI